MSETTVDPAAEAAGTEATPAQAQAATQDSMEEAQAEEFRLDLPAMLEAGVHFGHQTQRWNPRMRPFIFGERNGIHILDLDQSLPRMEVALEFLRDTVANGGKVLFVGTKKQASPIVAFEAKRAGQFYVNNRWLGGMLTNWRTVKRSIERYKELLELVGDEERSKELSKKELARINRLCEKYAKSLDGLKEMSRLPDVLFVIDVGRESIAVTEARRLGIPIVAVVDSNCDPLGIDFVVPGNDDSIRAISLYCKAAANACREGHELHQQALVSREKEAPAAEAERTSCGRRVVEIMQAPRRSRGGGGSGTTSGRAVSAGGRREEAPEAGTEAPAAAEPAAPTPPAEAPAKPEGES